MKNTATKILFVLVFISVSFAAEALPQRVTLENTHWKLTEANGRSVIRSSDAFIEINGNRMTGNTGCNNMFGSVDLRGGRIDFRSIGSTKRMCKLVPGNVVESTFISALNNTVRYAISGQQLYLYDRRGRTVLRFRATERNGGNDRARLDNQKWMLETVGGRQVYVPIRDVFLNFNRDGVGGNTGCNVFGGKYTASGSTISITEVISTMRACEEGSKMQTDREFIDGMRRADRFEITNGRLHLYRGQRLLVTFRGEKK